jgi:hypothetical protein
MRPEQRLEGQPTERKSALVDLGALDLLAG